MAFSNSQPEKKLKKQSDSGELIELMDLVHVVVNDLYNAYPADDDSGEDSGEEEEFKPAKIRWGDILIALGYKPVFYNIDWSLLREKVDECCKNLGLNQDHMDKLFKNIDGIRFDSCTKISSYGDTDPDSQFYYGNDTNFRNCKFINCEIVGFESTNFRECEFSCNKASDIEFNHNKLYLCTFEGDELYLCELVDCCFVKCKLKDVQFNETDICRSEFLDCKIIDCNFTECSLVRGFFEDTTLHDNIFSKSFFYDLDDILGKNNNQLNETQGAYLVPWQNDFYHDQKMILEKPNTQNIIIVYAPEDGITNTRYLIKYLRSIKTIKLDPTINERTPVNINCILVHPSSRLSHPIFDRLDLIHGIILPGGPNIVEKNERTELEKDLYDYAISFRYPLLGICRGHQLIAQMKNAIVSNLDSDKVKENRFHKSNLIKIEKDTALHSLMNRKFNKWSALVQTQHDSQIQTQNDLQKEPNNQILFFNQDQQQYEYKPRCQHRQAARFPNQSDATNNLTLFPADNGLKISCYSEDGVVEGLEINNHIVTFQHHFETNLTSNDKFNKSPIRSFVRMVVDFSINPVTNLEDETSNVVSLKGSL